MNIKTIDQVYKELVAQADRQHFCLAMPHKKIRELAESFVASFAKYHGLQEHLISPYCWLFDSKEFGEISDGAIKLDPDKCHFKVVKTSEQ